MDKLGLAQSYQQLVEKYGKDNADLIAETMGDWTKNYTKYLYLKMGVGDEQPLIERAREQAAERKWEFELRDGDWSLLKKLFFGIWDDDFVHVQPGQKITARNDDRVLDAE